jgi:multimeric flavodoxin WrbA
MILMKSKSREMLKIVTIMGSPHGMRGNTGRLLGQVVEGIQSTGGHVEMMPFLLSKTKVGFCKGCDNCLKKGTCPRKDGFNEIQEAIIEADGIVLASPNYSFGVSAQMKAFCDRVYAMVHCQMLFHKYSVVVTSGGGEYEPAELYLHKILTKLGCWRAGTVGATTIELADEEEAGLIQKRAFNLGVRLVQAIDQKYRFPEQSDELDHFFEMMRAVVTIHKDQWTYDYQYWQKRWGIEEDE